MSSATLRLIQEQAMTLEARADAAKGRMTFGEALNLGLTELLQRQLALAADLQQLAGHLVDALLGGSQTLPKRLVHLSLGGQDRAGTDSRT
jgi:hypothetical protein